VPSTSFDRHGSQVRWTELPGRLPARVFIHGLGNNGIANFGAVVEDPAIAGHRSLLLDLPGHGASDRPDDFAYSLEALAGAVAAACAAAGLDHVDLIGHSLGGDTAVVVAARYPGLVGRLVISEANLDPLPPSDSGRASQAIRLQAEEAFVRDGFARLMADYPEWAVTLTHCSPIAIHRSAVGLTTGTLPTVREEFTSFAMPRTFLHGDRGEPLLGEDQLTAAGVRVEEIQAAGHMVMYDNLPDYVTALAAALERVDPAG
jgi:pimeloyl-ACP methyl ester carboxylesterase